MLTQEEWQKFMMANFKTYFNDSFLGITQQQTAVTQTGVVTQQLNEVILNTGVQEGSTARMNYKEMMFNPRYGELYFKMRLNNIDSVFMFAGLVTTIADPEWPKDIPQPDWAQNSFSGIMLYTGTPKEPREPVLYFVTGNGNPFTPHVPPHFPADFPDNIQVTPIMDIDPTRWIVYRIAWDKFWWYSTPYTVPYFDKDVLPGLKQGIIRKWSHQIKNGSAQPDDVTHYMTFFIKNEVGAVKYLDLQRVNYAEVYPD